MLSVQIFKNKLQNGMQDHHFNFFFFNQNIRKLYKFFDFLQFEEGMSSEQSSFRDMFGYPSEGHVQRQRKHIVKGARYKKGSQVTKQTKESFYDIVQKAKHVAMFTQTLKQKIAQKRTLNMHTLKSNQMQFLENDSEVEKTYVYFQHDNKFAFGLQIVFIITIMTYLWKCTFEMVFGDFTDQKTITLVTLLVYIVHIIIFNFTQYKNQKLEIISNRNEINSLYMKEKLAKDMTFITMLLIQLTPLDNFSSFSWLYSIVRLISLISFRQLSKTCEKIENMLSISNQAEIYIAMFKLLFKVGLFLHFLSLALNLLAKIQAYQHIEQTWLTSNNLQYSTTFDKYIIAWYWGATILSTVGFGQITPKNNYERFFISIVQIICCMTIGYFVNVIGSLIKMKAQSQQKYEKQVRSLNRCLSFLSATNDLKHKIRTHYFNRHMIEKIHDPNEQKQLMQNLTPNLQKVLLEQNNITILKKSNIMQAFKEETLLKLAHLMKKIILAPQHIVYSRNSIDRKLWFIQNGQIQEYTDNFKDSKLRKTIYSYNEKDSIVGWINFLTQTAYKTITKAKIFTIAYELQEEGFIYTLKDDQREYHKFLHMKQQMIQKNRKFIHKCISCDRYSHNVINCPRIHFIRKDIKKLAKQHNYLQNYLNQQAKKKKYERLVIRYNWKVNFGNGQLQKQANLLMSNDSIRVSHGNIENLFKNAMFRQSVFGFQRKKMSFLISKKQNRIESNLQFKQIKENIRESSDTKSVMSYDEPIQNSEQFLYDRVFFNKQNNDYMPDHDAQKIITLYSNKFTRKTKLLDKVRRFIQP